MKAGDWVGLSDADLSAGRFRLRWRQDGLPPDGSTLRRQREVVARSVEERKLLEVDIERQALERGYWTTPPLADGPPHGAVAGRGGDAVDGVEGRQPAGVGEHPIGPARARPAVDGGHSRRPRDGRKGPLGVRFLNREDFQAMVAHLGTLGSFSAGTLYQAASAVFDRWGWPHDPRAWPEVFERPPANPRTVMPSTPVYEAPPDLPSWAECDACVARNRHPMARRAAVMMRYTGLRLDQVAHLRVEDVDLADGSMRVRKGKGRREQGSTRSPHARVS